jgi:hypothetical protein
LQRQARHGATYAEAGYAFATKETKGSSPQLVNEFARNRNTGLPLSSTDANGQVTAYEYEAIGRSKQSAEHRGDTNALTYKQTFDHDRFGNMHRKAAHNPTAGRADGLRSS